MRKEVVLGAVVIALAIAGLMWYGPGKKEPELPDTGLLTETGEYYTIKANYPTATTLKKTLGDQVNATALKIIKTEVAQAISDFRQNARIDSLTAHDVEVMGLGPDRKFSLDIKYFETISTTTDSYIFTLYVDTLGAHPNNTFMTIIFDRATGSRLSLSDIFADQAPYLAELSSLARAKLPAIIGSGADTTSIAAGTTPTDENFKNWFLTDAFLVILFPPYQVGAYALGPQTLPIPLTELSPLLRATYK